MFYNFVRVHQTLKVSPAMAAGVTDRLWEVSDLIEMLEAFEAAFIKPDNFSTNCNTLGGLVYWVRIEGKIFKDPGDIDSQTLLIVPLVVEMP